MSKAKAPMLWLALALAVSSCKKEENESIDEAEKIPDLIEFGYNLNDFDYKRDTINKGDTLKWYYGTKSDLTNVSNKTFTDSTKLFVTRTDSLGCVISSDTIQIKKYSF